MGKMCILFFCFLLTNFRAKWCWFWINHKTNAAYLKNLLYGAMCRAQLWKGKRDSKKTHRPVCFSFFRYFLFVSFLVYNSRAVRRESMNTRVSNWPSQRQHYQQAVLEQKKKNFEHKSKRAKGKIPKMEKFHLLMTSRIRLREVGVCHHFEHILSQHCRCKNKEISMSCVIIGK